MKYLQVIVMAAGAVLLYPLALVANAAGVVWAVLAESFRDGVHWWEE